MNHLMLDLETEDTRPSATIVSIGMVLFDPNAPFVLDRFALRSKSKNTPFDGARMEGRVIGTWVGSRRVFGEGVAAEARA